MPYQQIFENTYRNKKVFITGHTGFKGSWLLAWLHQLGARIKGYALEPEHTGDLFNLVQGETLCDSVIADIRDKEKLHKEVLDFQPDFIFHLAAQPLVRRSYEMPLYTFDVNVNGTLHLLEALKDLQKACSVVVITTDKVYLNRENDYAYNENDQLGGFDPYSASKAAAEIGVSSYRASFFNPSRIEKHGKAVATARAGNVIGGGDLGEDRIVPDIIRACRAGKPVIVRNPGAVRPWQHVLEPLSGYLLLGAKLATEPVRYAEAWNFGPLQEDVMTVEQLVKYAIEYFGKGDYELPVMKDQLHEAHLLKLDISKAIQELGWKPSMKASEAIKQTINWYKEAGNGNEASLTRQQIMHYQQAR